MNFEWSDYLALAQQLVALATTSPKREAMLRSAISRSYYSVFVKARNFLRDVDKDGSIPDSGAVHDYVMWSFRNSPNRSRRAIGTGLRNLRRQRNRADYDDIFSKLSKTANESVSEAQRLLTILNKL